MNEDLDLATVVGTAVRWVAPQWGEYISSEDMGQEAWVFALDVTSPERALKRYEGDTKLVAWRLTSDVANHLRTLARKEKAHQLGYDPDDEYRYTAAAVGSMLPYVALGVYEPERGEQEEIRTKKDPAEGNGWLALRADVSKAWAKAGLTPEQRKLLVQYHVQEITQQELADEYGVSQKTISVRLKRAMQKMVEVLGEDKQEIDYGPLDVALRRRPGVKSADSGVHQELD